MCLNATAVSSFVGALWALSPELSVYHQLTAIVTVVQQPDERPCLHAADAVAHGC